MPGEVLRIRHRGAEVEIAPGEEAAVGADPGSTLVVAHPGISRHHLTVRHDGRGWVLEDAGSTNGTFRDGERLARFEVSEPVTVLLGHPTDGEPLDLAPLGASSPPAAPDAVAGLLAATRRLVVASWVLAAVALAALALAVIVLLVD